MVSQEEDPSSAVTWSGAASPGHSLLIYKWAQSCRSVSRKKVLRVKRAKQISEVTKIIKRK